MSGHSEKLKIIIAAEPLENGAGLAMFLLDSVALFAQAKPDWQFTLLVLSGFSDAAHLEELPNVRLIFCDRQGWRGTLSRLLPGFRGRERMFNLLAENTPSRFIKKQFGNLELIWETLGRYDAVWVPHFAISRNRWPALYKPTIKSPVLLTIHDLHPAVFPEDWRDRPQMLDNFWKSFRSFSQKADAIITHSNFQKEAITKHFNIPSQNISVAYLPLPMNELLARDYDENEMREILTELKITWPYIFCPMSQITAHKNHLRTIEAWGIVISSLGNKAPQLVFTAAGRPEHQRMFAEEIRKRGLTGRVIFTGTVSREKLAILYRSCQALLSPTLYEGGGSGPVMEAVMAGRPVLCSDIPPIREQMSRFGLSAIYFDPCKPEDIARAVMEFLSNKHLNPGNDPLAIRKRLPGDREELARTYTETFLRITGNLQ
ncbi:MAG: glycosyltransferase family 1 protein [Deltaproteobacteria bacterium]|nr:glycosyltransferase family 1 protein [Deltaproteobacteria bacterium]